MPAKVATVASVGRLTPRMLRVRVTCAELAGLPGVPGQSIKLHVPHRDATVARDYTVRRCDGAVMDIDFALHADGPATSWAMRAVPGEQVEFVGPSGRYRPDPDADWLLFAGDETAIPAIFAMTEALPAGTRPWLLLEVANAADQLPFDRAAAPEVRWLHRGSSAPGTSSVLEAGVRALELPAGNGQVWLAGHTPTVRLIRSHLLDERGLERRRVYARGYWS